MVGGHLVRRLVHEGWRVHVLMRGHGGLEEVMDSLTVHHGDLTVATEVTEALRTLSPDVVFHLASTPFNPPPEPEAHFRVNVEGMANLLAALDEKHPPRLVFTSSGAVYGSGAGLKEDMPPAPATVLGETKAAAGKLLQTYSREKDCSAVELRLFTPYGPRERPSRLLPHVIGCALEGRPVELTSGDQKRDYSFVEDVIDALIMAGEKELPGHCVMNICSGESITVRHMAARILELMESSAPLKLGARPTRSDEIMELSGDNKLAESLLGWTPKIGLDEGLRRTIAWYRTHHDSHKG